MDLGTTITAVGLLLIVIIPFIIMSVNNNKKVKNIQQELFDIAEQNNSKITRHNSWDNFLIGIDDTTSKLFFIRKINNNQTAKEVDLAEIQKCQVLNNSRTVSNKEGKVKVTDQVVLLLTYYDKSKKEIALEFYNVDHDGFMLKGEVQLAEKWSKIINEAISAKIN